MKNKIRNALAATMAFMLMVLALPASAGTDDTGWISVDGGPVYDCGFGEDVAYAIYYNITTTNALHYYAARWRSDKFDQTLEVHRTDYTPTTNGWLITATNENTTWGAGLSTGIPPTAVGDAQMLASVLSGTVSPSNFNYRAWGCVDSSYGMTGLWIADSTGSTPPSGFTLVNA